MHDMYMYMSLLHTEYAAHSSQLFFQDRSRIFLQVFCDRSKHTKYGWVSSLVPRSLHDTFLFCIVEFGPRV